MKVVAILLLCVIPLISGDPTPSSKCYVDYLKNKGFLGGKKEAQRELSEDCVKIVEAARNAIIKKYRKKFTKDEAFSHNADCLIKKLKKKDFFDRELIKNLDFSNAKISRKKIESSESLGALTNSMHLQKAFTACEIENNFDDEFKYDTKVKFNELFEKDFSGEADDNVDYCARKHLIDNNLISFNSANFNLNPRNVDASAINCDTIFQSYAAGFEDSLTEAYIDEEIEDPVKWKNCFAKKIQNHNAVNVMLQFDYVKEFGLTSDQKNKLADQFVDIVIKVTRGAMNCNVKVRT